MEKIGVDVKQGTNYLKFYYKDKRAVMPRHPSKEIAEAGDALVTAFGFYFEDERSVPLPSKVKCESFSVSLSIWSKVLLLNTIFKEHVSQVELAKRLAEISKKYNVLLILAIIKSLYVSHCIKSSKKTSVYLL